MCSSLSSFYPPNHRGYGVVVDEGGGVQGSLVVPRYYYYYFLALTLPTTLTLITNH